MNPENLKQILDVISSVGGDVRETFLIYLAFHYGVSLIFGFMWMGCFFFLMKLGTSMCSSNRLIHAYGGFGPWTNEELDKACDILRKAKQ